MDCISNIRPDLRDETPIFLTGGRKVSIKLKWYDEDCYLDDDGNLVPPAEVRRRRKYYETLSSKELHDIMDPLPLGSGDTSIISEVLDSRNDL